MTQDTVIEGVERMLEERFGFACCDWQRQRIADVLQSLEAPPGGSTLSPEQLRMLAEKLTVCETYFFREPAQIDALITIAVPEFRRLGNADRPIRILSAGCASGEEAYSLAIALAEHAPDLAPRVHILGIDINPVAIQKAYRAEYSAWSLRATPDHLRKRWFHQTGETYQLRDELRAAVTFEERNLLEDRADDWAPQVFDAIFCRNVLIYFSDRSICSAVTRFAGSLAPGAFLFLGHSEMLKGLSKYFETLHSGGAFYHRRTPLSPQEPGLPERAQPLRPWHEDIRHASRRVAELTRRRGTRGQARVSSDLASAQPTASTEWVLSLIEAERFDEALQCLEGMAAGPSGNPFLDFLTAVILIHQGRLADADRLSGRLLATTRFEPIGHYLLGLCREQEGAVDRAHRRFEEAARMDPDFAMPCLRMGLLACRTGHAASARRHLLDALDRFQREQPERIRLLGGGFPRDALAELCRAQLRALGSKP